MLIFSSEIFEVHIDRHHVFVECLKLLKQSLFNISWLVNTHHIKIPGLQFCFCARRTFGLQKTHTWRSNKKIKKSQIKHQVEKNCQIAQIFPTYSWLYLQVLSNKLYTLMQLCFAMFLLQSACLVFVFGKICSGLSLYSFMASSLSTSFILLKLTV